MTNILSKTMNNAHFSVVVCTSNGYAKFLHPFLYFFKKNIKSEYLDEIHVVGTTDYLDLDDFNCHVSPLTPDAPWSARILDGLDAITDKYVLFLTEDIWMNPQQRNFSLDAIVNDFSRNELNYLRLAPFPGPQTKCDNCRGDLSEFLLHRISMQPSIWRTDFLKSLLRKTESIWEFELNGSRRSVGVSGICSVYRSGLQYEEVITRGRMTRTGWKMLAEAGLDDLRGEMKINTWNEELKRMINHGLVKCVNKMTFAVKHTGI